MPSLGLPKCMARRFPIHRGSILRQKGLESGFLMWQINELKRFTYKLNTIHLADGLLPLKKFVQQNKTNQAKYGQIKTQNIHFNAENTIEFSTSLSYY